MYNTENIIDNPPRAWAGAGVLKIAARVLNHPFIARVIRNKNTVNVLRGNDDKFAEVKLFQLT